MSAIVAIVDQIETWLAPMLQANGGPMLSINRMVRQADGPQAALNMLQMFKPKAPAIFIGMPRESNTNTRPIHGLAQSREDSTLDFTYWLIFGETRKSQSDWIDAIYDARDLWRSCLEGRDFGDVDIGAPAKRANFISFLTADLVQADQAAVYYGTFRVWGLYERFTRPA